MTATLRRLLTVPGYFAGLVLVIATLPVTLPACLILDGVRKTPLAITRTLLFMGWYLACECMGLLGAGVLWLWAQFARPTREHYMHRNFLLKCWWARWLLRGARWIFGLTVEVEGIDDLPSGPFVMFMRHASVADTILTSAIFSPRTGIDVRHVIKIELVWDPCLDIMGHRLPNYFVDRESPDSAAEIAGIQTLAEDLDARSAVLIYPEGTRFTEAKRARVLARLAEKGDAQVLERARALEHVLPPRPGGALGLLEAAPEVDVLFCTHVGFDGIQTFGSFVRGGLVNRQVRMLYWRVPGKEVPREWQERIDWLFDHWERMDRWIAEQKATG